MCLERLIDKKTMITHIIFSILFISIFIILFSRNLFFAKIVSFISTGSILSCSLVLLLFFNNNMNKFQHIVTYTIDSRLLNLSYSFGFDGISIFFMFLTALLVFLCVLYIWEDENFKHNVLLLLLVEFALIVIFSTLDLMLFYVFFEAILIPMYILIGLFGSRERKIRAVYLFFFYTLCSSLLFLLGILYLYNRTGTLNLEFLHIWNFTEPEQLVLWLTFFLSFASKIPMFPLHIWLPEAHVEAPTIGSVLLAGVLLKLGVYGFVRLSITLFPYASLYYSSFVYVLCIIGIIYASMCALRQTDLKRIIAYASIAHMNLVVLGIFSFNNLGLEGAILQSISHGFVAGGLFFIIGILYSRYHSRILNYYGGVVHVMPFFALFFLLFTLANIALPGTSGFTGEFLLLGGVFKVNVVAGFLSTSGVIFSGAYSLWLYNRVVFGNLKEHYTLKFLDITFREFIILCPLMIYVYLLGLYPSIFLSFIHLSLNAIISVFFY